MGDIRLTSPRVIVLRDGYDPLEIQTANPDLILWDRTRIKHRWPKFDEAPFLWLTFLAWAAARRTGAIPPEMTWDKWEAEVLEVTDANAVGNDETDELGIPIEPGRAPG